METSLVIYDDGEGQAPDDFQQTFLSLLRRNKNDVHFVQGKYNMGGAGAITFCGQRRYQLVASKRFEGSDELGFTIVRRHPLTTSEEERVRTTWYEYLTIDDRVPRFSCNEMDLGLYNRKFTTGTVIKLYSYNLPPGSRSVISRDLNQSINEYLFSPALPVFTIDTNRRYPKDRNPRRELFGSKRRLEEDDSRYIECHFSEIMVDHEIGNARVTSYVFKSRVAEHSAKETRETIQREFFKNKMSVLFSVNGQVHAHYNSRFITQSLKFPLLKECLLIHVDCTDLNIEFRNELFMASRDRLKNGEESRRLRDKLVDLLVNSRLKEIHKQRKSSITVENDDAERLLRNLAQNLPIHGDLMKLFKQTFDVRDRSDGGRSRTVRGTSNERSGEKHSFSPKRYPSFFRIDANTVSGEDFPMVRVPFDGERTIRFLTDAEGPVL